MMLSRDLLRTSLLIKKRIGEFAYASNQVSGMLDYLFEETLTSSLNPEQIREYVKSNNLCFEASEIGLNGFSGVRLWIPRSNLSKIIKGLDIPVTERNLDDAIYHLGFQY